MNLTTLTDDELRAEVGRAVDDYTFELYGSGHTLASVLNEVFRRLATERAVSECLARHSVTTDGGSWAVNNTPAMWSDDEELMVAAVLTTAREAVSE